MVRFLAGPGLLMLCLAWPAAAGTGSQSATRAPTAADNFGYAVELPGAGEALQLAKATPAERFDKECGQCHGSVTEFVEDSLTVSGGKLIGRGSEFPIREFMNQHRKLKPAEVDFYTTLLTDVAGKLGLK